MRLSLFDALREQKSKRLSKQLQKEADNQWQKNLKDRKRQEEIYELLARELQARMALLRQSDANNPFLSNIPSCSLSGHERVETSYHSHSKKKYLADSLTEEFVSNPSMVSEFQLKDHGVIKSDSLKLEIDNNDNAAQIQDTPTKPNEKEPVSANEHDTTASMSTNFNMMYHFRKTVIPDKLKRKEEESPRFVTRVIDPMADLFRQQMLTENTYREEKTAEQEDLSKPRWSISESLFSTHVAISSETHVYLGPVMDSSVTIVPAMFQSQENVAVYPTRMVRAGPPILSVADLSDAQLNTETFHQTECQEPTSALDQKIYQEPVRHMTMTSIYPGQRAWIPIYPTDTGRVLADRIAILASYRTRRVIKMITHAGKSIPIDHSVIWDELSGFNESEPWRVEWVPLSHRYNETARQGKTKVKHLRTVLIK